PRGHRARAGQHQVRQARGPRRPRRDRNRRDERSRSVSFNLAPKLQRRSFGSAVFFSPPAAQTPHETQRKLRAKSPLSRKSLIPGIQERTGEGGSGTTHTSASPPDPAAPLAVPAASRRPHPPAPRSPAQSPHSRARSE